MGGGGSDSRAPLLDLFYDGSFFGMSRLSSALKPFVAAISEVSAAIEAADPAFSLPYPISSSSEKVGGLPIAFGKDVQWTRALRLIATDLKWIVAWVAKRAPASL